MLVSVYCHEERTVVARRRWLSRNPFGLLIDNVLSSQHTRVYASNPVPSFTLEPTTFLTPSSVARWTLTLTIMLKWSETEQPVIQIAI